MKKMLCILILYDRVQLEIPENIFEQEDVDVSKQPERDWERGVM
jgi:hypothetical protein